MEIVLLGIQFYKINNTGNKCCAIKDIYRGSKIAYTKKTFLLSLVSNWFFVFLAKQLCYLNCILCNRFLEKRTFVFFPWYSYTQIDQELKHAIAKKVCYPLTSLFFANLIFDSNKENFARNLLKNIWTYFFSMRV